MNNKVSKKTLKLLESFGAQDIVLTAIVEEVRHQDSLACVNQFEVTGWQAAVQFSDAYIIAKGPTREKALREAISAYQGD